MMKAFTPFYLSIVACFISTALYAQEAPAIAPPSPAGGITQTAVAAPVPPSVPTTVTSCRSQIQSGFARLEEVALKTIRTQEDANRIVSEMLGPAMVTCEAGAYREYLNQFSDYASEVLRPNSVKEQGTKLMVAMALVDRAPKQVPFEEADQSKLVMQQMRSNLHAVAEDVRQTRSRKGSLALIDRLLEAVDAWPAPLVGLPPPPLPEEGNTIVIKSPTKPLPQWAVAQLYELQKALASNDEMVVKTGKDKLEPILRWIADSSMVPPAVPGAAAAKMMQSLMPDWVVQNLYELGEILKHYDLWRGSSKAAKESQQKELQEARQKVDLTIKWLDSAS